MANIFEDILTKLKSLSTNETSSSDNGPYDPSSYSTKSNIKTDTVSSVATTPLKVENTPVVETKTPKLTNTSVLSNSSTTVKNSTPTVKTYADFGNDNDYERYLVENKVNKSTGDALAYMQQKAKENNTTTRDYAISMTKRVKNTLNTEKLEANKDSLTDTQKEGLNQFGVLVDSNGNETDVNTYNNNVNLYKETADNINNQIQELNNAYTSGQIDYATMQSKYNELQSKWNENQLVGEDLSTYKSLSGFDYYDWAKANGKDVSEFEKYAESLDDSWIENIAEVYAASVADAINTPVQIYDILKNIVTGEDFTDSNTLSTQLNDAANELRTYAYAGTDGAKKWSTQLIDSLLPMVHSYINAYGITGLTGATQTGAALDKLVGGISTGILGAQTAGQVTRQRIEEGNDLTSSVINGVLHGAITTAVEGLNAGNIASLVTGNAESYLLSSAMLSKANPIKIAGYLNSIGASEGAEEIIESLADTLADKVQNSITDALDGTTLKKVNESELNVSDMANEFVMAYAGAVLMGLPTAVSVSLNSKAKYNAAESAKAYFQSTLDSEIATIEEKDLAYRAIEKINYDEQNSSYKKNNQIGDAITLSTDYVPTAQTYDDAMNNLTNAVQSDIQGELKTATDTLTKAKEMQNLFQNSLNERGINMTSEDYLNLTNEAKDNVKKVTRYADSLGTDVEWKNLTAKDGSVIDGVYENGHIVLNPNGKETALSTLVHEYTHGNESSKYYDTSRNLIKDYLGEEEFSKQKEDAKKNYSTITNLTDEQAEREVVAKTTQKLLGNEDFVERLVKYNNSLAFELWTDIKHLVGLNDNIKEIEYNFEKAFANRTVTEYETEKQYAFAGKYGVSQLLKSPDENVRNIGETLNQKFDEALQMRHNGATPKEIWDKTGWVEKADGKWRYEIFDGAEETYALVTDKISSFVNNGETLTQFNLVDIIPKDSTIYKMYADTPLMNAVVELSNEVREDGTKGEYQYDNWIPFIRLYVSGNQTIDDVAGTFFHELQHGVQHEEGFTRGTNYKQASKEVAKEAMENLDRIESEMAKAGYSMSVLEEEDLRYKDTIREINNVAKSEEYSTPMTIGEGDKSFTIRVANDTQPLSNETIKEYGLDKNYPFVPNTLSSWRMANGMLNDSVVNEYKNNIPELYNQYRENMAALEQAKAQTGELVKNKYLSNLGETEARDNTQRTKAYVENNELGIPNTEGNTSEASSGPSANVDDNFIGQDINDLFKDYEKKEVQRAKLEEEAKKIDEAMMNDAFGDNEANRKMFKKIRDEQGAAQNKATMDTLNAAEQSRINAEESLTMDEMQTIAEEAASASMSEEAMKSLNDYATEKHKEPRVLSEPSTKKTETKTMKEALFNLKQKLVDKGMAIREISRKAKNDNLEAKYDYYLNANNIANRILTEGIDKSTITQEEGKIKVNKGDKIKSLRELSSMINESEKADFDLYMYHYLNLDTSDSKINKPVFKGTTIQESQEYIDNAEKLHPEWKTVAEGYWKNTEELLNYLVEHGRLSEQTAKEWREMYPHYVPVMRADPQITETVEEGLPTAEKVKSTNQGAIQERTGGDSALEPLDYAMENYTRRVVKSALLNDFANEYRNYVKDADALFQEVEYSGDTMEMLGQEITKADDNSPATMISYTNGEIRIFEIPQAIYDALDYAQTPFKLPDSKVLTKLNSIRRNLITGKNPIFMITNPIKDAQDVIYNSKHALKTYANMPKAFWQLLTNGDVAQIFKANGGEYSTFTYEDINKSGSDFYNNTVGRIERANSIMEMTPRLAEFMASIESGRTIDQAMYDAAEVTTNFKRGGDYTKWADRNGATFLNASVQGFDKQVRMIEDAYDQKGWKGVLSHMAKSTLLYSLPLMVVNALRWKDDEDYEQLSDYVKENYYILFKYGDGQFFRIPKGRIAAAYQSVLDTLYENGEEIVGDNELTEKAKNIWENTLDGIKAAYDNIGINNPISNNIFAPIVQVANNESWYGDPIVSDYMAKKANSEQYDYSTDSFSVWLGKQTDISPKKINYLLDQYSGGLGDLVLPVLTPKAETGLSDGTVAGNVAGALISPLADKFTTDSVFKNQNVTDFYTLADELYSKASKENAADEVILSNKYINSIKSKMNELYSERNDIYNDTEMSDSEKYEKAKEVQKQVVELAQSGLATYDQIDMYENYAEINGVGFTKDEDGWRKASTETVDFINDLDIDNKVELKSKVLGATGVSENGKTVRNSKALEVADAYADAGVLDDVFKYIEENGIEPSDVGLTKTVAEKSYDEIAAMYEDIYGEVFGNEESKAEGVPTTSTNTGKTSTKKSTSKEETKIKNALNRYASALTGGTTNYYSGANTKQTTLDDVDKNVEAILKKYKV